MPLAEVISPMRAATRIKAGHRSALDIMEWLRIPAELTRNSNMPKYRAYIIGSDGEFHNSVSFECADDAVALHEAGQLVGGHHVELWQFTRKLATFDHKPQRVFQR